MGQHRHLWLAGISHADQSRFPLPRFDSGGADRARPGAVPRLGEADFQPARNWDSGVAQLLFQIADDGAGAVPRARFIHSADEAEEYIAAFEGGRTDHAFGI